MEISPKPEHLRDQNKWGKKNHATWPGGFVWKNAGHLPGGGVNRNPPPKQGAQAPTLVGEDSTCLGTANEPATTPEARALEPVPRNERSPHSPQLEKAHVQQRRPSTAK